MRRTRPLLGALLSVAAAGCQLVAGIDDITYDETATPAGGQSCAARAGSYTVEWRGGTNACGEFTDKTFAVASCTQTFCLPYTNDIAAGTTQKLEDRFEACSGTVRLSADNCGAEFDYACLGEEGGAVRARGNLAWRADGTGGAGVTTWTFLDADGAVTCEERYSVTIGP